MPRAIRRSPQSTLETGQAKLWVLLVGVNHYQDSQLPSLQYSAIDCQGLAEAITEATQAFPQKTIKIHHDYAPDLPTLKLVRESLEEIVAAAAAQDTVLVYFSGHGVLEANHPVLCLTDTKRDVSLHTGLSVVELLECLGKCAAKHQVIWLDACHSGGMTLRGMQTSNPTPQLMGILGQRATQSQGFYALLSCDQSQQSWEFPELGHGVFTYFLMRGLRGEAADAKGTIDADGLYKYVYHQTLQYIDKTNQQLRLINQQKRGRGETQLQPEYPLQTPKRIVEGIGELVLGVKSTAIETNHPRQAIVVETFSNHLLTIELSKILRNTGDFELAYYPQPGKDWCDVRDAIHTTLNTTETTTALIYLRGKLEQAEDGDACLILGEGERLSRSWLRQELRHSMIAQQILILDCPGATSLADWVEDLQSESDRGHCIIAAASPTSQPGLFAQTLLETLRTTDPQTGLSIAGWITQLQLALAGKIPLHVWLSGAQGVIEVLPGQMQPRTPNANLDIGLCPYRGLQAFTEDDAQYFYGRESLTQQLLQAIQQQACLAVVGASGSGKSSIVQAGLISQLRQGQQIPGSDQWLIARMRPGDRPLDALAKRLVDRPEQQLQIEGFLHQGSEGFVQWIRTHPEPIILLVVDQFEELFTLSPTEDRRRFLALILEAVQYASDRFKLVLTLRADFMAAGLEIPELAPVLQRSSLFVSPSLADEDYRSVIVRPAEQVGLTVEPALVEVLLKELDRSPGNLPLLEFVLEQLWQQRESGQLTLKAYQQQIGGLQGALERKAQSLYDSLDQPAQDCARWIFLSLTQLGDNTEDTRRRILKSDLVVSKYPEDLVDRTLQTLTNAKLIVINTDDALPAQSRDASNVNLSSLSKSEISPHPTPLPKEREQEFRLPSPSGEGLGMRANALVTIEVAHEILIRHWSTLRWWLDENRSRLRAQRQIEQVAMQWDKSGRQDDFLLRGIRLAEAEELYIKYTDELPKETQQFIEACLEARQREQNEAKRQLKRAQRIAVTIGVLGLSATGFAGLSMWNQRNAQIREVQALSASSEAMLNSNSQLESLIAAVRAGRQIQQLDRPWNFLPMSVKTSAIATLQQALTQTRELNRLTAHAQQVNSAVMSPDGQTIATASNDGTVKLWKNNGQFLRDLTGHQDRVLAVSFSSGSSLIATASADKTIRIWNRDGKLLQTLTGHTNWVTDVQFNPKGKFLASASRDGTIKLWRLGVPIRELNTLRGHQGWVNSIRFSADGQQLASGDENGIVRLWQANTFTENAVFKANNGRVTSVAFSPNGKRIAIAGDNKTAKLFSTTGQEITSLQGHSDQVNSISFNPDGTKIATASLDGTIRLWSAEGDATGIIRAHGSAITHVDFSRNGLELLSASADKTARIWRVDAPGRLFDKGASVISVSPDGNTIAVANSDNTIHLWRRNHQELRLLETTLKGHTATISALAFSPNGQLLASASADRSIQIWDMNRGTSIKTITGHQDRVTALSFRFDGNVLASGSADKTIKLWSIPSGQLVDALKGHEDEITALSFSADGRFLASGSADNTIRLWYPDSINPVILGRHKLAIASLTFSPDGKRLASASWDNTIQLWTVGDAKPETEIPPDRILAGHNAGVLSLSFSPNGQLLASGSDDNTIKLWNTADGELLKTLTGTNDRVQSVVFSRDGRSLISTSDRTGLLVWDLDLSTLLKQGCDRLWNYLRSNPEPSKICSN